MTPYSKSASYNGQSDEKRSEKSSDRKTLIYRVLRVKTAKTKKKCILAKILTLKFNIMTKSEAQAHNAKNQEVKGAEHVTESDGKNPLTLPQEENRKLAITTALETEQAFKLYSYRIISHENFIARINELTDYFQSKVQPTDEK